MAGRRILEHKFTSDESSASINLERFCSINFSGTWNGVTVTLERQLAGTTTYFPVKVYTETTLDDGARVDGFFSDTVDWSYRVTASGSGASTDLNVLITGDS